MPLLDHFTDPGDPRRRWATFHTYWTAAIGRGLNRILPERFFAAVNIHLGSQVAADVAEFDTGPPTTANGPGGGVAVQPYVVPAVTGTASGLFPDEIELPIVDTATDRVVAVIELVSPGNKDRPDARRGFAAKCAAYLQRGVGLVVVDAVLVPRFNLHNEMIKLMDLGAPFLLEGDPPTYAVGYQPVGESDQGQIVAWPHAVEVAEPLPTVPLYLRGTGCIPLDLEESYMETRRHARIA